MILSLRSKYSKRIQCCKLYIKSESKQLLSLTMSGMVVYLLFNGLIGNAFHVLSVQLTYTIWMLKVNVLVQRDNFCFDPPVSLLSRFQTRIKPLVITMKFNRDKSNTGSSPSKNFAAGLPQGKWYSFPSMKAETEMKAMGYTMASIRIWRN